MASRRAQRPGPGASLRAQHGSLGQGSHRGCGHAAPCPSWPSTASWGFPGAGQPARTHSPRPWASALGRGLQSSCLLHTVGQELGSPPWSEPHFVHLGSKGSCCGRSWPLSLERCHGHPPPEPCGQFPCPPLPGATSGPPLQLPLGAEVRVPCVCALWGGRALWGSRPRPARGTAGPRGRAGVTGGAAVT